SLKTSIKTITYLSDIGCLEIQGASLLIELPARGLARVNGSDIERFYYNEDFVEKDGNDVVCEIFIPVRPV
ncbi:hypothetical protein MZE38_21490, partial [Escherichia coli]|nr:hypothetical protein [Escherichia coli]